MDLPKEAETDQQRALVIVQQMGPRKVAQRGPLKDRQMGWLTEYAKEVEMVQGWGLRHFESKQGR